MKLLPNILSLLRLTLSPLVIVAAYLGFAKTSAVIFLLLAVSDAADGFLARRLGAETFSGKLLDPIADKALMISGLIVLTYITPIIEPWLIYILVIRDTGIIVGSVLLIKRGVKPKPSIAGKITTWVLSTTILFGFTSIYFEQIEETMELLTKFSTIMVIFSGVDYLIKGVNVLLNKVIIENT